MWTACVTGIRGTFVPVVHRSCPHNEVAALALRVLAPLPPEVMGPLGGASLAVWRELRLFCRRYGGVAWGHRETAESYSGALGRRYAEAARSLREEGLSGFQDSYLRAFLKAEKNRQPQKLAKPRLIFPRSPRFNLEVASRLKPFEHWLWGRLVGRVLGVGVESTRLVAKGLTPRQRANLIVRKFRSLPDCVCFEVDGRAFEAHVGPAQLEQEHAVYRSAFPGDRRLATLLRAQENMSGVLSCGAKFTRPGGRASGDFNTGMGNSLVFLVEVVAALRGFGCVFDVLVDGDNCLIFLRGADSAGVVRDFAARVLASSGHEVVLERPTNVLECIRFGGSAPVFLGPRLGWSMVREWERVISGAFSSHRYLSEPKYAREWMTGVAMCELSIARGVPVLQAWALWALRRLGHTRRVRADPFVDYFVRGAWLAGEDAAVGVSAEARLSFERAYGLTPEEQCALEDSFASMSIMGSPWARLSCTVFSEWEACDLYHESWR